MEKHRKCNKCEEIQPIENFYRDSKSKGGRRRHCKTCSKLTPSKQLEARHEYNLMKKYGLTKEQYNQMLIDCNNRCQICGTTKPGGTSNRFCVDHCHKTNKVRGLLCWKCNCAISHFNEDVEILQKAINYLAVG